jgi:hypothetical protein
MGDGVRNEHGTGFRASLFCVSVKPFPWDETMLISLVQLLCWIRERGMVVWRLLLLGTSRGPSLWCISWWLHLRPAHI